MRFLWRKFLRNGSNKFLNLTSHIYRQPIRQISLKGEREECKRRAAKLRSSWGDSVRGNRRQKERGREEKRKGKERGSYRQGLGRRRLRRRHRGPTKGEMVATKGVGCYSAMVSERKRAKDE
ncbi:Uncharacterized protein TCM_043151 [Theobroma cacao]|uniref:Uncharacterized protein n=1 Tax=Theobroma cacao TaxID=3641 RepID=A0A061FNP9_THECC|nr:Uncharacterized protein TCM_043151 [Theobroma cacao]